MTFTGFTSSDFETFTIEGLDERMKAIRERIQPKFHALGEQLCDELAMLAGNEMFVHIAKHARRTVNPPKDTWMAFCHNKRGYKQHPHFQIGLFDDHVFVWLAFIYELPDKKRIASSFLQHVEDVRRQIPQDYVLSFDHMKKDAVRAGDLDQEAFERALIRFRDVKKAELLIGRHFAAHDPALQNGQRFTETALHIFEQLMPLYQLAF